MWIVVVNEKYDTHIKEFDKYRDALKYYKMIDTDYLISNQMATNLECKYLAKVLKKVKE